MYNPCYLCLSKLTLGFFLLAWLFLVRLNSCQDNKEIDHTMMLYEVDDREKITSFPEVTYKSLQASSLNRESVSLEQKKLMGRQNG